MMRALAIGPPGALCSAVLAALGSLDIATHHVAEVDSADQVLASAEDRLGGPVRLLVTWVSPRGADRLDDLRADAWDRAMNDGPRRIAFLMQAFAASLPDPQADATGETVAPGLILNLIDQPLGFWTPKHSSTAIAAESVAALTRIAAVQLAPRARVNAVAPATQPAELRDGAREVDLSPDETRLPCAPETLAQVIAHMLSIRSMTGQIVLLQTHASSADQAADHSS